MAKIKPLARAADTNPSVVMSLADEVRAEMAADKAAKLDKNQLEAKRKQYEASRPPVKASEAYGQHEGSYIKPIFYDRMLVDLSKGKFGGPGFSGIQLVDPEYQKARAVAGVTDQKMATRIINRNKAQVPKGAKVIWTPSVGGLEQHKSNSTMFAEFADIFASQRNKLSPEEIQKLSDRASSERDNNGRLIFPNGIDLSSRNFRKAVKTYDQRALMANIFAGRGVGGEKGRTVPMEELLQKNLDPNMGQAGTLDLGNRLFRLDDNVIDRPDLHSDYPKILTGEDLDVNYLPTPIATVFEDFKRNKQAEKGRDITLMDYTKNDPTQLLTEDLLTRMQKAGYRKGGLARMNKGGAMKRLFGMGDESAPAIRSGQTSFDQAPAKTSPLSIVRNEQTPLPVNFNDKAFREQVGLALTPYPPHYEAAALRAIEDLEAAKIKFPEQAAHTQEQIDRHVNNLKADRAARQFGGSQLSNYMIKKMGTPSDPIRKLAQQGISAVPTELKKTPNAIATRVAGNNPMDVANKRVVTANAKLHDAGVEGQVAKESGMPLIKALRDPQTALAANIEYGLDSMLQPIARKNDHSASPEQLKYFKEDEMFVQPEVNQKAFEAVGFTRLSRELQDAIISGEIRPEQVSKISMEDLTRRVHKGDVKREQEALAEKKRLAGGLLTHETYGNGFSWQEFAPKRELPEGYTLDASGAFIDPKGNKSVIHPGYDDLQRQLEAEGEMMGHCVGDYCDKVWGGETRVLSLRDKNGDPHVTVEVKPNGDVNQIYGHGNEDVIPKYTEYVKDYLNKGSFGNVDLSTVPGLYDTEFRVYGGARYEPIPGQKPISLDKHSIKPMIRDILKGKGFNVNRFVNEKERAEVRKALSEITEDDYNRYMDAKFGAGSERLPFQTAMPQEFNKGGLAKKLLGAAKEPKSYGAVDEMVAKVGAEGRSPIVPVPNRWFLYPDKFPNQQKLVERILATTGKRRLDFPSGAFIDPRTGQVLDANIVEELGVVIDPKTNRPMMSSGAQSQIEVLDPKTGSYTKSNLVRKGLFKPEGGDPLLKDLNFIATIEKGDVGHKYGLSTEYASPTELFNTQTGANPTLRPRSRGDLFGMGEVVGRVKIGKSEPHDVYEKLFVAPKGSDVPGKKLNKNKGGLARAAVTKAPKPPSVVQSLADEVRAEMAAEKEAAQLSAKARADQSLKEASMGMTRTVPREQADLNLKDFLAESADKNRYYHGTFRDPASDRGKGFKEFRTGQADSTFLSPDPTFAGGYAGGTLMPLKPEFQKHGKFQMPDPDRYQMPEGTRVMPVYAQVKKPFDYENREHVKMLAEHLRQQGVPASQIMRDIKIINDPDEANNWMALEKGYIVRALKDLGHDGMYVKELDTKNLGVFNPNVIKSAIGNKGTYDTSKKDITQKKGGLVGTL